MSITPSSHDESSGEALQDSGLSRRNLIKYGSLAAGALVATPTILTLGATPASASGQTAAKFAGVDDTTGTQSTQSITAAGLWVVGFAVRGANNSGTNNVVTIDTPAGWTAIGSQWGSVGTSTNLPAVGARLIMKLFYRYYATSPGSSNTVIFSHSGTSALVRAFTGFNFPNATVVNSDFAGTSFSSNNSASAGSVTSLAPAAKYLYFSVASGTGTPTFTNPDGYSGTSNNVINMGIASAVPTAYAGATGSTSGTVTGTWTGSTIPNKLAAIIAIS